MPRAHAVVNGGQMQISLPHATKNGGTFVYLCVLYKYLCVYGGKEILLWQYFNDMQYNNRMGLSYGFMALAGSMVKGQCCLTRKAASGWSKLLVIARKWERELFTLRQFFL